MRILYPFNPLNTKEADEPYQEEYLAVKALGVSCSLFDFDMLEFEEFRPEPKIEPGEIILYRGWMLKPELYELLTKFIVNRGGSPLTSLSNYLKCHHLPGWYDECKEYTAETVFFPDDDKLEANIASLYWEAFFVKDYVKSNSTEVGSLATTVAEAINIVELIKKFRGGIEGGVAIRRVEEYIKESEIRYFVMNGKVYSPNSVVPQVVASIAAIVMAPFYSIDTIQNIDGNIRLVEIGDGQVSDKKSWDVSIFAAMLAENS
ncbi:MAG: ATP-grasp domain-containing protein [Okeania sp. SIO3B5]|uniref:ATP-grasp domain-containing protein n=1 Tax=Okeania sp. SIO3B5 TaxID=2607811 RepID=UPI0013FEFF4D|nr:ATP-grasp domain-containing protein [Okeania sp. SIO3B5]NEO57804.1 ATP-grasp domain-containing protein [Okeania sp. SIO3B5]